MTLIQSLALIVPLLAWAALSVGSRILTRSDVRELRRSEEIAAAKAATRLDKRATGSRGAGPPPPITPPRAQPTRFAGETANLARAALDPDWHGLNPVPSPSWSTEKPAHASRMLAAIDEDLRTLATAPSNEKFLSGETDRLPGTVGNLNYELFADGTVWAHIDNSKRLFLSVEAFAEFVNKRPALSERLDAKKGEATQRR